MAAYSITSVKPRFFDFVKPDGKGIIHIEPPTVKTVAQMQNMDNTNMDAVSEMVSKIISKNKEGYKISTDDVQDVMTVEQMLDFLTHYFDWLNDVKATDPN